MPSKMDTFQELGQDIIYYFISSWQDSFPVQETVRANNYALKP